MNNRFLNALNEQKQHVEAHNPLIAGTLGITMSGQYLVEVPDRPSYVYVQVRSSQAEVIQAFNSRVSPVYGLPVFIQWEGNRYIVVDRDSMRYTNWVDNSAYVPRHASQHERIGSAGDVVFVSQDQFLPLMPMPSGSLGNTHVLINDYNLMTSTGTFQYSPLQATIDLTVWNPSSTTGAVMVLVSMDGTNGSLVYTVGSGSVFGNWLTGASDVMPHVPAVSDISRYLPLAAVRLISGTSTLTWDNIYDVRPIFGATRSVGGGGGGGGGVGGMASGTAPIWLNNGVFVATGTQINMLGAGFTIGHSGTEIELTIAGGGGGGTSGSLLLNTSNGPLTGPLVVYQQNPNTNNQYFDYSTIVGFMSGTNNVHFGAAVEAVVWSTGSNSYGVFIDDEGAGNASLFIQNMGLMDKPTVDIKAFMDGNRQANAPQFNPSFRIQRFGNGTTPWRQSLFQINTNDTTRDFGAQLDVQVNNLSYTYLWPNFTGTPFSYPFDSAAAYFFDTAKTLPTGTLMWLINHRNQAEGFLTPDGVLFVDQYGLMEHTGTLNYPKGSSMGMATLNHGTVTIPTQRVSSSSRIFLTVNFPGTGTVGFPYVFSRSAGSGFTILSSSLSDNSRVAWLVMEPFINQ